MELIFALIVLVATLALLDYAALRWGYNSRTGTSDWMNRTDLDFYEPEGRGI